MSDWETFTPPGIPAPAVTMYAITVMSPDGEIVGKASHGWDVLAKLRNTLDRGYTNVTIRPISSAEAKELDPGPA